MNQTSENSCHDMLNPVMNQECKDHRSDAELIRAFANEHDQRAINVIVDRHGPMVLGVCRTILRNGHAADDAFQATFLVLLSKARSIGKPASLACWLHGVACRVAKRAKLQGSRSTAEVAGLEMKSKDPAVLAASEEVLSVIHEEIEYLPERFRMPLILCAIEGESREDAAKKLGWSVGSVKGRLERGREMLQVRLKNRGVILPTAALSVVLAQQAMAAVPPILTNTIVNASLLVASGQLIAGHEISMNAILLSKGVIKTMLIAKASVAALAIVTASVVIGGSGIALRQILAAPPVNNPVVAPLAQVVATQTKSNAKQNGKSTSTDPDWSGLDDDQIDEISLRHLNAVAYAVHAYLEKNGTFPPATVPNPKLPINKRLSGFVLLLPYFGVRPPWLQENDDRWQKWHADNATAKQLFDKIDLKKAWDDPTNDVAAKTLVQEFVIPGGAPIRDKRGYPVSHFAFVRGCDGKDNGAFPLEVAKGLMVKDIIDGTSVTLAVGQINDNLGPWIAAGTSTARFLYHPSEHNGNPNFGGPHPGCVYMSNCDASVYLLDMKSTDKKILRWLAGAADDEIVNMSDAVRYANSAEWKASGTPQ